jgi:hypothetical protein
MERNWNEMNTGAYSPGAQLLDECGPIDLEQLRLQTKGVQMP